MESLILKKVKDWSYRTDRSRKTGNGAIEKVEGNGGWAFLDRKRTRDRIYRGIIEDYTTSTKMADWNQ